MEVSGCDIVRSLCKLVHDSSYTIDQSFDVEVNDEAEMNTGKAEVAAELSFVQGGDLFPGFQVNDDRHGALP